MGDYEGDYARPTSQVALTPAGHGKIITWTVRFARKSNEPETGVIIGEMVDGPDAGKRFFANKIVAWCAGRVLIA